MTMTNTATTPLAFGTGARLSRLMARATTAFSARAERRANYRALIQLSDRQLEDIGFTRGEVEAMR